MGEEGEEGGRWEEGEGVKRGEDHEFLHRRAEAVAGSG